VDWLFDGADIAAVCRTAYDDQTGGAANFHDANFLTFHRFANFRRLTMADSVPVPCSGGAFGRPPFTDGETTAAARPNPAQTQ
jgi:hypothetical protein